MSFHRGRWKQWSPAPRVASCTVTVDQDQVETCSGPEAAESLTYGFFGEQGTREFFTHVRFHKHDEERIIVHLLVESYARSAEEATEVLEEAFTRGPGDHLAGGGVTAARPRARRGALAEGLRRATADRIRFAGVSVSEAKMRRQTR